MASILIIEDDLRIAENIAKGLNEKGYASTTSHNGIEALELSQKNTYDLILLDLNLPGLSGYSVCKKIRENDSDIPIIMLTALGETDDKIEGFNKGADDYIVKPFDFRELLARVNVLLKRARSNANESIFQIANLTVDNINKTVKRGETEIELTQKEFNLLIYLINNKNSIVSKAELGQNVWNLAEGQSLNVVEVYINFLRKKIDKHFKPKLIHTKSGLGYILKEP